MITVADKIGKDYKKWENYNKVFISAPTGSGKTYFILNVLLPYACSQNKKILFLVNRKILKTQMETEISIFPFEIAQSIRVETYQTIEKQLCEIRSDIQSKYIGVAGNKALKKRYEGFDYVVCDECHYFLTDSNYNTNTEVSFRWIQDVFANKVRIFMSATINEIREFVNKDDKRKEYQSSHFYHKQFETTDTLWHVAKRKEVYEYLIEKDYKYVDVHIIEDRDDIVDIAIESKEKWLIFVDSIVYGKSLERNLNAKLGDVEKKKSVVLVTTDYKRDEESAKEVAEIAKTSMFSANILITMDTFFIDNELRLVMIRPDSKRFVETEDYEIADILEACYVHVPLPFRKGDIVKIHSLFWRTEYGVIPFNQKDKENDICMKHGGDGTDITVSLDTYLDWRDEFDYTDATPSLALRYCSAEELPEKQKILEKLSQARKGEIDWYSLLVKE